MATVGEQIQCADDAICRNIQLLADQRALLSQNVLSQLRNLVEGAAVLLHQQAHDAEFKYPAIEPALAYVKRTAKYNVIGKFHKLIQVSASHFTLEGDASERLMLKYYEYLYRLRALLRSACGLAILANLESFPVDLDPSLREYHEKISRRISALRSASREKGERARYYVHRTRPFFVDGQVFYEVTLYRAINKVSKFDRTIAFTHLDITDKYAANLTLMRDSISVLGQTMPVMIIGAWEVSIRPCELNNFARIFGLTSGVRTDSAEYRGLMERLTASTDGLLDLVSMPDAEYLEFRASVPGAKLQIFPVLDEARRIIRGRLAGQNVIRYLMLRMRNQVIKPQFARDRCGRLSNLKLQWGCIPFDTMPFCTSLIGHNPRYGDLLDSLDVSGRQHELLAREVRNNVERHGTLYTPLAELEKFGDPAPLVTQYNGNLYRTHVGRQLIIDRQHAFIRSYEDNTVAIIESLREISSGGIAGYTQAVTRWLEESPQSIDDDVKKEALKRLFAHSKVALIYGAAGTGKSTMVDHIANYFNDKAKLFLAHTNPAIDNLRRKVNAQDATFRTISSHINRTRPDPNYDLLVIDECSTVSNDDLLRILQRTSFRLLVLVGDVYQIESIQFGNWFSVIRSFVPKSSVFELTTPFRTKNPSLLAFWEKVRNIDEDIAEIMARHRYSSVLDSSLFEPQSQDEIILCLNYDGLYGINNVNRFLQSSNPNPAVHWQASTFKVGDPVLFNDSERFRPVIYNNLKGWIVGIKGGLGEIQFDVELDRPLSAFDVDCDELEWVRDSVVRFSVFDYEASDDDDDSLHTAVPFQVAYAVSIHKAQGLEYDSVKVVVTDANQDDITHSIFYTAVTRARQRLRIFWTPETQQRVLHSLRRVFNSKDIALISARRGLDPAS